MRCWTAGPGRWENHGGMHRDIVLAGHYCHDTLIGDEGERRELGGSTAYASAVLAAAGVDFTVVASVGEDFRYGDRVRPARVVPGARTTSFVDDYRRGERVQTLEVAAPPLLPGDLLESCTVGMACGVAGEVPPETLARLRELARVLVVDAQGFVRGFGPSGRVVQRTPPDDVLVLLERADYLKASRIEAEVLDVSRLRKSCTVIVTEGARGCTVLTRDVEQHVPAFTAREIDPTGAGDCFLAGFAVGLLRGWGGFRAARLGNWCGAQAVQVPGVPRLASLP